VNYLNNSGVTGFQTASGGGNSPGVQPPLPSLGCRDSDGINPNIPGEVHTSDSYSNCGYRDYCYDTKNVVEQYCDFGARQSKVIVCQTGYTCVGGACTAPNSIVTCTDDDKNQDVSIFGQVTTTDSNGKVSYYPDVCSGTSGVGQYYCFTSTLGYSVGRKESACPAGTSCSGGICKALPPTPVCGNNKCEEGEKSYCPPCTQSNPPCLMPCTVGTCPQDCETTTSYFCQDSDKGKDYYTYGSVSEGETTTFPNQSVGTVKVSMDNCKDTTTLNEYYCPTSTSTSSSVSFNCPYGCSNGACKPNPGCVDSDSGKNYYVKGQTTGTTGTKTDYCSSTTSVVEYYCIQYGYPVATYYKCYSGCSDGACIIPPLPNPIPVTPPSTE